MKKILITGGAGFIGTNIIAELANFDCEIVAIDNLSNSYQSHINSLQSEKLVFKKIDLLNLKKMDRLFKAENFDIVIHMASKKYIGESFVKQNEYFENNITATQYLLDLMTKYGVKNLVFASSMTVYGTQEVLPIKESTPLSPESPYAITKSLNEKMIKIWSKSTNSRALIFRMSNPIGANTTYMLGDHNLTGSKNVLSYLIECAYDHKEAIIVGGSPTKDGTTTRNYIHISDIARAYKAGVEKFDNWTFTDSTKIYNLGNSEEISVLDLLKEVENTANTKINYSFKKRKEGDVVRLTTCVSLVKKDLKFKPEKTLHDIIDSEIQFNKFINKK